MKTILKSIIFTAFISINLTAFAQVGINTNTPEASAALDVTSTEGGILIPRLTETQRDAITSPATGLMVFQTDQMTGFYFFDGAVWAQLEGPAGTNGTNGTDGIDGAQGIQGETGSTGPTGAAGTNGTNGTDGQDGAQGIQGETGATGPTGVDGTNGTNGTDGIDGAQGIQGETGATGPSGANGANGSNGIDGAAGVDGTNGPTEAYVNDLIAEAVAGLQSQIDDLDTDNSSGSITDQDNNTYNYITYGDQLWTVENAEMVTYRDGTSIPQVTDNTEWHDLTTGAWAYYNNDPTKPRLYNWYAVMGIHDTDPNTPNKEFVPEGWHVPSDAEWTTLVEHLIANGYNYDGSTTGNKIAKAMASTRGWVTDEDPGSVGNDQSLNNSSGFNAFPEGYRFNIGSFLNEGANAFFWSSTENNTTFAWYRTLGNGSSDLGRYNYYFSKQGGFSVRFVRD